MIRALAAARALALTVLAGIVAGGLLWAVGRDGAAHLAWAAVVALALVPLVWSVARDLARGRIGVDVIALLAMAGALALGEYLAGAVIALMLAGGNALEETAGRRARRELTALVDRAPRHAHLARDGSVAEVPVEAVVPGDLVLVRTGDVLPVDGTVEDPEAILDEAALTGESLPALRRRGAEVRSGTANAGPPFALRATRSASESAYAGLVRLVRDAGARRAPLIRMADRYAVVFLVVTLVLAGVAWAASGDPVRALAVLVVATPCPLILAAPVALISGVSRAARRGIVVKGAAALERLGGARTVLLDKTGTLTEGAPRVQRVRALADLDEGEILRLAAAVEQLSPHVLAEALVHDGRVRGRALPQPTQVLERPGQGIEGRVDGHRVAVGTLGWLGERGHAGPRAQREVGEEGTAEVWVGVDGRAAGVIVMADRLRPDARDLVARLRESGVRHVALATGDRLAVAERIGAAAAVDRVYAEQSPEDKVELVRALQSNPGGRPVVMVGDGVNDAPALALADVGLAMGAGGATVSSETADAVILVDRVDRVAEAIDIGRRSVGIARQSVVVGIGLSLAAMVAAAFGLLAPVAGAVLQEVIDVAVILNALRALGGDAAPAAPRGRPPAARRRARGAPWPRASSRGASS